MAVIGFNLKKILVERKGLVRGSVKVSTNMNITDIKKEETKMIAGKDVLGINFDFVIFYKSTAEKENLKEIAKVSFEGTVLYIVDPKETNGILESWKKKEISEDIKLSVLNTILVKCNVKALVLEEDLGLPPHLPLPKFKKGEGKSKTENKKNSYTG